MIFRDVYLVAGMVGLCLLASIVGVLGLRG